MAVEFFRSFKRTPYILVEEARRGDNNQTQNLQPRAAVFNCTAYPIRMVHKCCLLPRTWPVRNSYSIFTSSCNGLQMMVPSDVNASNLARTLSPTLAKAYKMYVRCYLPLTFQSSEIRKGEQGADCTVTSPEPYCRQKYNSKMFLETQTEPKPVPLNGKSGLRRSKTTPRWLYDNSKVVAANSETLKMFWQHTWITPSCRKHSKLWSGSVRSQRTGVSVSNMICRKRIHYPSVTLIRIAEKNLG